MKHYFKNGKEYKGKTHKDAKGKLMSGAKHSKTSKYLVHFLKTYLPPQRRLLKSNGSF